MNRVTISYTFWSPPPRACLPPWKTPAVGTAATVPSTSTHRPANAHLTGVAVGIHYYRMDQ